MFPECSLDIQPTEPCVLLLRDMKNSCIAEIGNLEDGLKQYGPLCQSNESKIQSNESKTSEMKAKHSERKATTSQSDESKNQ
jgi:hypothetical protein